MLMEPIRIGSVTLDPAIVLLVLAGLAVLALLFVFFPDGFRLLELRVR